MFLYGISDKYVEGFSGYAKKSINDRMRTRFSYESILLKNRNCPTTLSDSLASRIKKNENNYGIQGKPYLWYQAQVNWCYCEPVTFKFEISHS
jgi:hypothetical protein